MSDTSECYLGDGLYASFDGWQIVLRAPRPGGAHWVGLDPEVISAFGAFLADLNRQYPGVPVFEAMQHAMRRSAA
jgi:hypothetical protein